MTIAIVIALIASPAASAQPQEEKKRDLPTAVKQPKRANRCPDHRAGLAYYRLRHDRWTTLRGVGKQIQLRDLVQPVGCKYVAWLAGVWKQRSAAARQAYYAWRKDQLERQRSFRALYEKWRCIHEHEGAWNANTGNGYYGGLQMDGSFMWAYGREFVQRWGTADKWPVWAQLQAAERAYAVRGFGPWPNTRRMCGQ